MFLWLLVPLCTLFAQQHPNAIKPHQYRAFHWRVEDGLSSDIHNTMIKDVKGFLWIGSADGELCRFDGASFKKYIPDPHKRGAINSGSISALKEDSLHNIWIGTAKGLSRYDMKADTFTNFVTVLDSLDSNRSIVPFWSTSNHVYCLESGIRIVAYNIYSLKKKILLTLAESDMIQNTFPGIVYAIVDTVLNCFWMLESRSAHKGFGGLLQISLGDGKRQNYAWPCYRNNLNHRHSAEAMRLDRKRNSIWVNSGDGLMEFSLDDKQFRQHDALNEFVKLKDYRDFVGIDINAEGRIWLATYPKGILIYDPKTKRVRQVFSYPDLQQETGDANFQIYCDRDGIVWTSYWRQKGIYELLHFDPPLKRYAANPKKTDSLSNSFIHTIIPAADGKIWIGTDHGLNIFDPVTDKFEVLREKDMPGIRGNAIKPLHIDTIHQKAWLNVGDMRQVYETIIYEMDIKTKQCRPIVFRDGSKQFDKIRINSYLTSSYKNGLLVCDQEYGVFEIKTGSLFANLVIPLRKYFSRLVLEENRFLFLRNSDRHGSLPPNFTFENINGKWIKIPHLLDSLEWKFMLYNKKDQTHWVSLRYVLIHYDKWFRVIKTYSLEDRYNGAIFNMQTDNAGNLWFINDLQQIVRLNTATGIFTTMSEVDGYQKQYFEVISPGAKDARGNLYFGGRDLIRGSGGLDRINPEKYSSTITSIVYLRSLAINQKPFSLSTGVNTLEELSLKHNQNTITIETGIIDYYAKGKGRIRYKLEGNDKKEDWQYAPSYYTIRYDGLVPGNYKLVLQASNAGNEFNSPEKILMIDISPPFWETWWFRILAAVAVIAILVAIIEYRSRSLKQQNTQLEEKVMHRTKELKHSLEELKSTQAQLIQSEKMASLGELTAGIAHEIQNPLNFVNNFSEVSNEMIHEMKTEIVNNNKEDAIAIADDVKQNLEKIIHHGKRADAIVKGMLQHSRVNTGQKELTDINSLADGYLRLAYHGFRAKDKSLSAGQVEFNATMRTNYDDSIGKINIIPQDIGKVILNLINNAFYAVTEKKQQQPNNYEPVVTVTTRRLSSPPVGGDDGCRVEIKVSDNGNGIPPKVLDKIFQPFFTTKPAGQGTGLGLSLSYDIIKAYDGELKVETTEGEGAEFIISLPI